MNTIDYSGKKITVMGLGFHHGGEGVARYFAEKGARVTVTDLQNEDALRDTLHSLADLPIRYVLGRHDEADFTSCDLVIRNPGVPHTSRYLSLARASGVSIEMESSLFFKLSPSRTIIAVTGTKGKSTTASLAAYVCETAGLKTHLMGNIVKSMLGELPYITEDSVVVLELSSYQCEGFSPYISDFQKDGLGPHYAVITNLYPDHLNRYSSMEEYATAKKELLRIQNAAQKAILNREDDWCGFFEQDLLSQVIHYDSGTLPTDWHLRILGAHNRTNAGAIYTIARDMGIADEVIKKGITTFSGVDHRLEYVRTLNGVDFYNDTTATNPSAAIEGIRTIQDLQRPIVLLAGGNDKGMDFVEFVSLINSSHIKVALLEGTASAKLTGIAEHLIIGSYTQFAEAINAAYQEALPHGIVLLSPGATSFNLFRDEFDRGNQFRQIVQGYYEASIFHRYSRSDDGWPCCNS